MLLNFFAVGIVLTLLIGFTRDHKRGNVDRSSHNFLGLPAIFVAGSAIAACFGAVLGDLLHGFIIGHHHLATNFMAEASSAAYTEPVWAAESDALRRAAPGRDRGPAAEPVIGGKEASVFSDRSKKPAGVGVIPPCSTSGPCAVRGCDVYRVPWAPPSPLH